MTDVISDVCSSDLFLDFLTDRCGVGPLCFGILHPPIDGVAFLMARGALCRDGAVVVRRIAQLVGQGVAIRQIGGGSRKNGLAGTRVYVRIARGGLWILNTKKNTQKKTKTET